MSESPRMSLSGSKDETDEPHTESTKKQKSPEHYAPYCNDSDSETYDTEALSMMDINDIIGVQSEPVGDSLESEIDALSKIITDTKDGSQKSEDADSKEQNDDINWNVNFEYEPIEEKTSNETVIDNCSIEKVSECDTKDSKESLSGDLCSSIGKKPEDSSTGKVLR